MTFKTCLAWALAGLLACSAKVWGSQPHPPASHAVGAEMANCQGPLAQKTWQRWDEAGQAYATQMLQTRLQERGDTYVLYDLQTQFHNLLAMADRCGNAARLRQMAALAQTAYGRLEPEAPGSTRRRWVCRGGAVCNSVNKLVNTEVMLTSVQFLAFATHSAVALQAQPDLQLQDRQFVQQTALVAAEHLLRWGDVRAVQALQASLAATPQHVTDGRSRYFLTDKVLWQLAIYARLSGLLQRDPALLQALNLSPPQLQQLRTHAQALAALVQRRITYTTATDSKGRAVLLSDLDVGYWSHYIDNRYAAYTGADKPAICETASDGTRRAVLQVPSASVPVRDDIGWDLSHARRLVHYFDAINAHSAALALLWQVPPQGQTNPAAMQGFARQLLNRVWSQDVDYPLFANYYSGANGWYRVGFDNGTSRCMEGYPPYGLTDSFVTGGYASWSGWQPMVGQLAWRIYTLTGSIDPDDQAFVERHYRGLSAKASTNVRLLQQLMFWPSLVH